MPEDTSPRILLIEDDAGLVRLMERRLARHGYSCEISGDGASGLARLREDAAFDVVVIDYEMPGLNGLQVLSGFRQLSAPPPAIMMSGAGNLDTAVEAMRLGAADYVVKAVDDSYLDLLPATIERVLENQRLRNAAEAAQRELAAQAELLQRTISSISQGLSVFDAEQGLLAWNDRWLQMFGYPAELARVGTPYQVFADFRLGANSDDQEQQIASQLDAAQSEHPQVMEFLRDSGQVIAIHVEPMDGGGFVSTYTDITASRSAEQEKRLAAAVFDTTDEAMLITDPEGSILRVNPALEQQLGFTASELIGRTPALFASGMHDQTFFAAFWDTLLNTGSWRGVLWNRRRNGELIAFRATCTAIVDDHARITHLMAIYGDVTEELQRSVDAEYRANHDHLTGLPNRSLLLDRIDQAISAAERDKGNFAVLFLDLDGFKPVNDQHGHRVGDVLLQELAQRLRTICRDSDTVARLGGDEFVLLLRNYSTRESLRTFAGRLLDTFIPGFRIDDAHCVVSASIGIAVFPEHGQQAESLLKHADEAMYAVKHSGKKAYAFFLGQPVESDPP